MNKDTRTAWGQEFDAKREAWSTIDRLKAELAKVTAERDEYKLALVEIESPIRIMQQRAKFEGAQINGQMAVALSNDPCYLKDLATTALRKQAEAL